MKRIYHFYLTCMTLTLTMPMMIVSVFAVDDMWTVANNIIVDVYGKIVGVSTVLAGLMSAVAVIGAKLSNNQHKVDQAWDWLKRIWIAWAIINGIGAFTITANSLAEPSTLFITAITRSRGHNPWGSARVGAIAHLGSTYYAAHYIYSGIGRMAVNDELAAFHNHTNFGKDTQRAFLFAGASYADIIEELKVRDEKRDTKLIRYSEAYRGLHYPVHLLSCDETGARQLQIMAVPDYRVKISKLMLRSAYRPPPEDAPAWDATYQNRPFVIGADMNLRRIDAAIASAKKRGCLPISLAALDAQGDAVLLRRYKDTGYAVIYKVTESVLTELFGHPPSLYLPPCTQYLTKKGAVVDAPLIQVDRKDRGSPRK